MSVYIRSYHYQIPDSFIDKFISEKKKMKGRFGQLSIDSKHKFYPKRSDAKIMRKDVISSIVVINEMLEKLDFPKEVLSNMGLFIANGSFLEEENKNMQRAIKALKNITGVDDKTIQLQQVFRSVSPLTALETLTNSTMSFIAQYTEIKGNNSTFGTTSYGGFSALEAGIQNIILNDAKFSMVGGANGSGVYAALNYFPFYEKTDTWVESEVCSFILLQKERNGAMAKITQYKAGVAIPSLLGERRKNAWANFFKDTQPEMLIFSGGFTKEEININNKIADSIGLGSYSWNQKYGNFGAASLMMSMVKATQLIADGHEVIDVVDRDPYGREVYVQLTKVI